ncbi:hypothetical protein L6164_002312 [Bauhinia variegata]|uniref:Uncharacterized protein n=1 Tax=Bauhinia variegata TaxID=167791 RepID=A0ACB9PX16_BAUVA|nr:hypothetical protein L6164_002312 [Bauhinia variegata]
MLATLPALRLCVPASRFLATAVNKGARCDPIAGKNVCKCASVLGDMNHFGQCGQSANKDSNGTCTNVNNCSKCNKK